MRAQPQLPALTSIRFFAALHVVVFHDLLLWQTYPAFVRNVFSAGYVGVSLFYVLSGFILTYTYAASSNKDALSKRDFWVARFARIYPAYLFSLLLALPGLVEAIRAPRGLLHAAGAVAVLGLVQSWYYKSAMFWNAPCWSLSVEAFFYLVFPFLLWRLDLKFKSRLLMGAAAAWVIALSVPLLYLWLRPDGAITIDAYSNAPWLITVKFNPLLRLPEFAFGILLGHLYRRVQPNQRWADWLTVGGVALVLAILVGSPRVPYPLLHDGLLAPGFGMVVFGLALGGRGAAWLSAPPLVLLGDASYSLYLLHGPLWILAVRFFPERNNGLPYFAVYLAGSVLISIFSFKVIEQPARRAIRRWYEHASRRVAEVPVAAAAQGVIRDT